MARKKQIRKNQSIVADKPQKKQITTSDDWHEVLAIALAGVGLLGFLALISYAPDDFTSWRPLPSGGGVKNYVGPVGAVVARAAFFVFGAAAYLGPVLAMAWAVVMLTGRWKLSWPVGVAVAVWLLSSCCILDFQNLCLEDWVERYALPGSKGGVIGAILGRKWLAGTLGEAGASVLLTLLYFLSLMVGTGARPFRRLSRAPKTAKPELALPMVLEPQPVRLVEAPSVASFRVVEPEEVRRRVELPRVEPRKREEPKAKPVEPPVTVEKPPVRRRIVDTSIPVIEAVPVRRPAPSKPEAGPGEANPSRYQLPSFGVLTAPELPAKGKADLDELRARQMVIIETLRNFRVRVEPGDITRGPSVTRYEFYPERGLSVRRIAALEADIALATRAKRITILAPIPGKDTVGIELANEQRVAVGLRELVQGGAFTDDKVRIPLALGKDVYGKALVADLAAMPHLLIAGATGSGKSVCLNTIVASLLYRFRPDELRLIMIDPKVVEMQAYARLPHLAVPVVTETKKVLTALRWCINEMERRYRLFSETGVRKVDEFNARLLQAEPPTEPVGQGELFKEEDYFLPGNNFRLQPVGSEEGLATKEKLPRIVVIIDELADLMQVAGPDVETCICRLCQKARAAGIHVIVATQSPRADVVTGLIKANIPARIAFQVSSGTDSRVILDKTGAERLVGKGDFLFQPPDSAIMVRAQGAYLSDEEVERLVDACAVQTKPEFDPGIRMAMEMDSHVEALGSELNEDDEDAFQKALELIREEKRASTSFLQRRLRLGYTRAARLMDLLEERGVVGPAEGAKPREILVADPASEG